MGNVSAEEAPVTADLTMNASANETSVTDDVSMNVLMMRNAEREASGLAWSDIFLGDDGGDDGVVSADGEVLPVEVWAPDCEGDGEVGGVSGDIEMASGVGDLEDRGRGDGLLELVLAGEFVERVRDLGKVANEWAVIVGKAKEGTELEEGLGWGVLDEGCDLRGVHTDAFSGDNMAEVFDARSGKRTFAELGVEFLLSEDREDLAEVLKVGLEGGAEDKDVIKVDNDTDFKEVAEDVVDWKVAGALVSLNVITRSS
ncbi:hypothetical protein CBR_g20324 [Chara braunii]|uniref:Uncharacterized protein n=1 Tax=Chara braunii TaxID=69332 RepID=A0A388L064_CHABU|nr:hypothetical protein CBR_g20324 [Chara braunii]|eukprot:GBG75699.1 hypothetical protein CBR_g20324 [Chara braunii]